MQINPHVLPTVVVCTHRGLLRRSEHPESASGYHGERGPARRFIASSRRAATGQLANLGPDISTTRPAAVAKEHPDSRLGRCYPLLRDIVSGHGLCDRVDLREQDHQRVSHRRLNSELRTDLVRS
jgi:hypothetical protein